VTCTRLAVYAKDVRNGDVLIEQRRAVIDHCEFDKDINDEPVVLLVPRGSDHTGYWYHTHSVVTVHRFHPHTFD
jgi:hypothetical protein